MSGGHGGGRPGRWKSPQPALHLLPTHGARKPFHVRCCDCRHLWIAAYFPMEMTKALRLLKGVCCPMCGAGPKRIVLATDVAYAGDDAGGEVRTL